LTTRTAFEIVDAWLRQPSVTVPELTVRHLQISAGFDFAVGYRGNLTADAHLAALAIERALSFAQRTNDFGRFNRVRSRNPLSG